MTTKRKYFLLVPFIPQYFLLSTCHVHAHKKYTWCYDSIDTSGTSLRVTQFRELLESTCFILISALYQSSRAYEPNRGHLWKLQQQTSCTKTFIQQLFNKRNYSTSRRHDKTGLHRMSFHLILYELPLNTYFKRARVYTHNDARHTGWVTLIYIIYVIQNHKKGPVRRTTINRHAQLRLFWEESEKLFETPTAITCLPVRHYNTRLTL